MRRANLNRMAKVIATLGPATSSVEMISALILTGMSVARINMSHGTHQSQAELIKNIRLASSRIGLEVAILLDLQGPKIRVGKLRTPDPHHLQMQHEALRDPDLSEAIKLSENLELKDGESWAIGPERFEDKYPQYKGRFIPTVYEHLVDDCDAGTRILFDDGLIIASVLEKMEDILIIKVISGGILKSHKGINLPDSIVSAPSFTEKDHEDLIFGLENGVDYIALSFVRKKEDLKKLRDILVAKGQEIPIISKIENHEAINNIDEIIKLSDLIMVARGDMGVEIGNQLVPAIQKKIVNKCNKAGKPVIIATQMLESMIRNPTPTRAEASDVANAIWDGADAVMLSGETAYGRYPLEAVRMMGMIITEAERTPKARMSMKDWDLSQVDSAIMIGASLIAEKIKAKRILAVTQSGNSCLKLTRFRSTIPILGVSNSISVVRRMCLLWGVSPFYLRDHGEDDAMLEQHVIEKVRTACDLSKGDKIVITRGSGKFFARGTSNSTKVVEILE